MIVTDIKMAVASLKSARMRSLLTMFGVVIGVASVVLTVALGEGVKRTIIGEIERQADETITIRSGRSFEKDAEGHVTGINVAALLGASTLTEKDVEAVEKLDNVEAVAPIGLVAGLATTDIKEDYTDAIIIATTPNVPEVLDQKVKFGDFFAEEDDNRNVAVIGSHIANDLFRDESPIGRRVTVRGTDLIVKGVMERFDRASIDLALSYNSAVFIPAGTAKRITGGSVDIREIQVRVKDPGRIAETTAAVKDELLKHHRGQEDFTILNQSEFLEITDQAFTFLTAFVAAVAGISLFVGGVGIMNIMLVSVTERTREIGIRKSIGATNRQILSQFMTEAIILSVGGGIIGVIVAAAIAAGLMVLTDITPSFEPRIVGLAMVVSIGVGIVFGITPALKAARKNPIEALRHD